MTKDLYSENRRTLRRAFHAALTAATLVMSGVSLADEAPGNEPAEKIKVEAPDKAQDDALADEQERTNYKLLRGAELMAASILEQLPVTPYGKRLLVHAQDYNEYLVTQTSTGAQGSMQFVDPDRYAAAAALSDSPEAIRLLLKAQNPHLSHPLATALSYEMQKIFSSPLDYSSFHTKPSSWNTITFKDLGQCVAIPASSYEVYVIGNLNETQRQDFIAAHEAWHCIHSKYNVMKVEELPDQIAEVLAASKNIADIPLKTLTSISIMQNRDMFADLGAAGDLILMGHPVSVIDDVAAWRHGRSDDYLHLSVAGLVEFKKRVTAMGADTFRQMDAAARENLFYDITDNLGFTPDRIKTFMQLSVGGAPTFTSLRSAAAANPTGQDANALRMIDNLMTFKPPAPPAVTPDPAQRAKLKTEIRNVNPRQLLYDEAYRLKGEITPETMVHGYVSLMTDLQNRQMLEPDNPLYAARMAQFTGSIRFAINTAHYIQENLARGVDVDTAPSISRLLAAVERQRQVQEAALERPLEPEKSTQTPSSEPQTQSPSHAHGAHCDHTGGKPSGKISLETLRRALSQKP